jgi:UbiD family decarboxylase
MPDRDLRVWMAQLEAEGEFKKVTAKVDWDDEISQIIRKVYVRGGPALLFENIKGHEMTRCRKLFTNGLGTQSRVNLMLNLLKDTPPTETLRTIRERMKRPLEPVRVKTGPVKENIVKGKDIDLFQFPVPKWHPLDNGRYINTFNATVTKDPDTGQNNAGVYRGTILHKNKVGVLLMPMKDWGITYSKYREMGKPMPVAFVYGYDPTLIVTAGSPVTGPEYDLAGALRQEPVRLVKCETSDIEVPASAGFPGRYPGRPYRDQGGGRYNDGGGQLEYAGSPRDTGYPRRDHRGDIGG